MKGMLNEFRIALRGLARSPAFTAVAVLTLALGIGANTAIFTLVDGVLLRSLPYPQPDRLVSITHEGRGGEDQLPMSTGMYVLYGEHARSLEAIALHQSTTVNFMGDDGEAQRVLGQAVTPSLFEVLRVPPMLGRPLLDADGEPGAEPVIVLSHALWSSLFGRDPQVIDRTVITDGVSRRVVGVMPERFAHPDGGTRLWIPLPVNPVTAPLAAFGANGIARLSDGATAESAHADLAELIARLDELRPEAGPVIGFLREVDLGVQVQSLKDAAVGDVARTLWTLLGMVGFVLLIACANVANLLLVRADGRQREVALRRALGARGWDVLRPFLAESAWLAAWGGVLGVAVAAIAVRTTIALAPSDLPRMAEIGIDLRILAFTAVIALLSALLFGLFPALRYGGTDLAGHFKDGGGRGGTAGRDRHRIRSGLVIGQVALALILLVGSGLMIRSLSALLAVDPGFETEGVLAVSLNVPAGEIASPIETADFYRQLVDRLAGQPGVHAVGAVNAIPLSGQISFGAHAIEDHPTPPDALPPMAFQLFADGGYFESMGIPVVEGRNLEPGDRADGFRGLLVSQSYADRWWPSSSAVGRRVQWGPGEMWEIVGVVEDVRNRGLMESAEEILYLPPIFGPTEQPMVVRSRDLVIRVAGDPLAFLPVLRRELRDLNARIPLDNPRTMTAVVQQSASQISFTMVVLSAASIVALLLGVVGIYGVVSYVVSQRTREIGVRMALGAPGAAVRAMVVRQGMMLVVLGVAVGLAGAVATSRLLESLLYGIGAIDPLTYAVVAGLLGGIALIACWIPARKAAAVDPAIALRHD